MLDCYSTYVAVLEVIMMHAKLLTQNAMLKIVVLVPSFFLPCLHTFMGS